MGMFDEIYNSCDRFGNEFTNKTFQTKMFDSCLELYWLSPAGELFYVDYHDTYVIDYSGPEQQFIKGFPLIQIKKTEKHGLVRPYYYSGEIVFRGEKNYANLSFLHGKVVDYVITPNPYASV